MKKRKSLIRTKYRSAVNPAALLVVFIGIIICATGFFAPVTATEPDTQPDTQPQQGRSVQPLDITIHWEEDVSATEIRTMSGATVMSEQAVLTVAYTDDGELVEVGFTQDELDEMMEGPFTYSNYNTNASYGTNEGISGVKIKKLFYGAGINTLNGNQLVKFISGDGSGFSSTITVAQLFEDRYFFTVTGAYGGKVPAIIGLQGDNNLPRNFFGQAAAGEQTRPSFVSNVARIEIGGDAGIWGQAIASPVSGSTVSPGTLIRLSIPQELSAEAKIYYTLDDSTPTRDSNMFNLIAPHNLSNHSKTENDPIIVPDGTGTFTVKAKVIGLGRADGPTVSFIFNYNQGAVKGNQNAPTGISGSALSIIGTTDAMQYSTSQTGATGWFSCSNGSTGVAPGTYFVRFAETKTLNPSPVVMVVVSSKLNQSSPTGLTNGVSTINGTTTAMEYHTDPYAVNGWTSCSAGSTSVVDGTYFVRFAETATHNASASVEIVIGKLNRAAPLGLSAGEGAIIGTTTAMEYNTTSTAAAGWITCTNTRTVVTPGTYFVRFAETDTYKASAAVMLVVTEEVRGQTVISVSISGQLAKEFTQADLNVLQRHGPNSYSNHNTWPTYGTLDNMSGVRVLDLLAAAGVSSLSSGQGIRFVSADGYSTTVTVGQLEEPRYFYSSGGARVAQVPSIINLTDTDYRRLAFGQVSASEQTNPALVKDVVRIDVGGGAGNWGSPGVTPPAGTPVKQGDPIRLTMPSGQGDAKIYYTLDGSVPTRSSNMYNPVADRWLSQRGITENTPISAPSGPFTINARIIGVGRSDGPVVTFRFNEPSANKPGDNQGVVIDTSIEDLMSGNTVISSGNSIFVPAAYGSIKWDESLFDGYYDYDLGGYILTPKPGVTGEVEFTYVDEDGTEHTLVLTVEEPDDSIVEIEENEIPMAGQPGAVSDAGGTSGIDGGAFGGGVGVSGGSGTSGSLPQWAFISLCAVGALIGAASGIILPGQIRKISARRAEVKFGSEK